MTVSSTVCVDFVIFDYNRSLLTESRKSSLTSAASPRDSYVSAGGKWARHLRRTNQNRQSETLLLWPKEGAGKWENLNEKQIHALLLISWECGAITNSRGKTKLKEVLSTFNWKRSVRQREINYTPWSVNPFPVKSVKLKTKQNHTYDLMSWLDFCTGSPVTDPQLNTLDTWIKFIIYYYYYYYHYHYHYHY